MNTSYPTLDFNLGSDIDLLRDAVYQFSQAEIAPLAEEIDKSNNFPMELWPLLGEMGLLGITVDEKIWWCWYELLGALCCYGGDF